MQNLVLINKSTHFIMCNAVPHRFYVASTVARHFQTFSVQFVARLIKQYHFVAMYACLEMRVAQIHCHGTAQV